MVGHHGVVRHQDDDGVGRVLLFSRQAHQFLETGFLRHHASKGSKPALNKWILKRLCNGLRNFIPPVSIDFHHLAKPKQERCHDGETPKSLA